MLWCIGLGTHIPTKLSTVRMTTEFSPNAMDGAAAAVVQVAVHTPLHARVGGLLSYSHTAPLPAGTLVRVPLGARQLLGVVWDAAPAPP